MMGPARAMTQAYLEKMTRILDELERSSRKRSLAPAAPVGGMAVARDGRRLLNFSGNALRAVQLLPGLASRRARLSRQAGRVRAALRGLGIDTLASDTQIIPAIIGSEADTLAAARDLAARGILAAGIRPPTVPPGTGRLRLTLSSAHSDEDLDRLIAAFGALGRAGA